MLLIYCNLLVQLGLPLEGNADGTLHCAGQIARAIFHNVAVQEALPTGPSYQRLIKAVQNIQIMRVYISHWYSVDSATHALP